MTAIHKSVSQLCIGNPVSLQNLTMFPLLGEDFGREADYLTLDEALARKQVHITEVDASGSVPELRFVNEGDQKVLLMDGEELVGAKQNRTLNISILAAAHCELRLPVTCVEAGRWSHASAEFASAGRSHYAQGRMFKQASVSESLHQRGDRMADQGEVWADIGLKAARLSAPSRTQAMAAMYERHETDVEQFVTGLAPQPGQCGAIFAIGSRIVGCDLFDCPATFSKLLAKIVRSYALDAVDEAAAQPSTREAPPSSDAHAFLERVGSSGAALFPAVGLGEDARLQSPGIVGGALIVDGQIVHMSAFVAPDHTDAAPMPSQMSRASTRRQNRSQAS